jgi:serine/threonine-protein kinase
MKLRRTGATCGKLKPAPVARDSSNEIELPSKIGRYDIRAKLADGGMATIYVGRLAGPAGFERLVAIKVIKPEFSAEKSFTNMFLDEARIAAKLSHPSIVQVHELGEDESGPNKRLFLAMELLFGESLWDVWYVAQRAGAIPFDIAAWIGARVAEGLYHAHELKDASGTRQNVIHRDINPSNLFVTYDGQVKIIDFGLAKAKNRITDTGLGVLKGKVAYMAPEQTRAAKDIDHRADIFALGTTLYELTTNRRLFKRKDNVTTLTAVSEARVPDPAQIVPDYPPALWAVLKKALAKSRDDRYATAQEFANALDGFAQSQGRVVSSSTVAKFMEDLFGDQRERYSTFLEDVRSSEKPIVGETFRPPPANADENAEIVGVSPPSDDDRKKPDATTATEPLTNPRPDPYAPPSKEDEAKSEALAATEREVKESRRLWLWALVFLALGGGTIWYVLHSMS